MDRLPRQMFTEWISHPHAVGSEIFKCKSSSVPLRLHVFFRPVDLSGTLSGLSGTRFPLTLLLRIEKYYP